MQGGDQGTDPRPERADASQPFQLPSSSQPENGHPAPSTTSTPSLTTKSIDGGTFKPFGAAQAKRSPARNDFMRQPLFVPPSPSAHDRSPPTLPSMSSMSPRSVQQRPHPIRRPLANGAVYGSGGGAALVHTGAPFANSLAWSAPSGSTSRFAEATMAEQPLAVSAQTYSHATPYAPRCVPDPRTSPWTTSFAPFSQVATAPTGCAAAKSTTSYSPATAITASFGGIKVDVKASESSYEDEIILATRSKTVPASAREVRRTGDSNFAHMPSFTSPEKLTSTAARPAAASSASPPRIAPRSDDRTRPRSAASSTTTSSTRSSATAALNSRSTSPRRADESRTTVLQAAADGFMRRSPTEKVPPGPVSSDKDADRDRAAPKRHVRQDDFELDIPEYPVAAIRNGARTDSAPLGEPSSRNASSEMIMGGGVYASKRQKVAPPLVTREEPLSDPRLTRSSRSRRDPAATQESSSDGSTLQSQRKGKGKVTSPDPRAAASTTRLGRHFVPARSTPNRIQSTYGSVSPLTSMDESSDDDDHQTKPRKPSTSRGRMLPRARSAPRTSNASVSYIEPTEDEFVDELPLGKKAEVAAAVESDAFDSDADGGRDSSSDDVWTPAAGARSGRARKRPRTSKAGARSTKAIARPTTAEPISARTVSAVATNGRASDGFGVATAHGVAEILPTGQPQFASTSSAALSASRPPRRSRTAPSADGTPRAWAPAADSVTRTDKDDTIMQPLQDAAPDELLVAGPSGAANDAEMDEARAGKYGYMLQPKTCVAFVPTLNNSLRPDDPPVPRCQECIKKQSGFVCCFKDVRSFPLDQQGRPLPFPVFHDSSDRDEEPLFPTEYNEPFTIVAAAILKTTCADALLPSLKRELAHSELPRSVRLRRQLGTTYTCDGCAASFLCGSWMCRTCGREYCLDCLEVIKQLPIEEIREHSRNHRTFHQGLNGSMAGLNVNTVDKLTRCVFLERHGPEEHIPVIRLERPELRRIVDEMTVWRKTHAVPKPVSLSPDWIEHYRFCPDAKENSLPYLRLPGQLVPPVLDADHPLIDLSPSTSGHSSVSPTTAPTKTALPPDFDRSSRTSLPASLQSTLGSLAMTPVRDYNSAGASTLLPPYQQVRLPAADITQHDLFHALWSLGEPLVIDLAPEHYPSLPWTPTFFIQRFGQHACTVGSNRVKQVLRDGSLADRERTSTVAEFFETFGKTRDGSDIEKIKDWPSARDFKAEYPELWKDFMAILPAGSTTRRDGILDIASHTPVAANPPDLGPKGYFSQTSDDRPGGSGSTKLHMDVADAVNVMLWASDGPDGLPGVAAWDLYRAEDADLIRDFLYETIAESEEDIRDAAETRMVHDDPIHAQRFYLDAALRRSLFEKKGVRSFRVLQRPGQAVFIPAGCAHQVCNMSDCIKVATDFVSIENVSRCWKVTDEFREQTKDKVLWRSDVLQLKTMLLWAWRSAERFDSPGGAYGGSRSAS